MLELGNIKLNVPFFQAALSGYSDKPMRCLAREFGAPLAFTGVMLDKIALHAKAIRKLKFGCENEPHPVGAQIMGKTPEIMAGAAKQFLAIGYDLIDLNFACPAPKVLRRGRGGSLMKDPARAIEIMKTVRDEVSCPLLIKVRKGYDSSQASREDFWNLLEGAKSVGVDAVCLHGRTVTSRYRGKADWNIIAQVKQRYPDMTLIGSGDIFDAAECIQKFRQSNADGFLVARGAIGNPWLYSDILAELNGNNPPAAPTLSQQHDLMRRHFEMILEYKPEQKAIPYFRKFLSGYCKRHPKRKETMLSLMAAKTKGQLFETLDQHYSV